MQRIELIEEKRDFRSDEAIKTLRTNVEFSAEDVHTIAVTSCLPNEGKSTISMELAKSFSRNGRRTLLIDADLRKSVLRNKIVNGKVRYGLSDFLVGKVSISEAICETNIPNMYLLYAGYVPPNPTELLGTRHFKELMKKMRAIFDIVIVDTPPIGSVIDAVIVSKCVDGVVVVMKNATIKYPLAIHVKEQLDAANAKVLGCVLNEVDTNGKHYYERYYRSYYGKYYGKYYGEYYGHPEDEEIPVGSFDTNYSFGKKSEPDTEEGKE